MSIWIRSVNVEKVHGFLSFEVQFSPEINVLYGRNGSGKTTLLHILANVLNEDFERFRHLVFSRISVDLEPTGDTVEIVRDSVQVRAVRRSKGAEISTLASVPLREEKKVRRPVQRELWEVFLGEEHPASAGPRRPRASYFPAFRTMIEAWSSAGRSASLLGPVEEPLSFNYRTSRITAMARQAFGSFIPVVNYPSLATIERDFARHLREARYKIAENYQRVLTDAFVRSFEAALLPGEEDSSAQSLETVLDEIRELLNKVREAEKRFGQQVSEGGVYDRLRTALEGPRPPFLSGTARRVLLVYREALRQRLELHDAAMAPLEAYVVAVNEFLEGKRLVVTGGNETSGNVLSIEFDDGRKARVHALSSGERQIVTMLYAAMHSEDEQAVVLIDEPEISLHVDWQRRLLSEMRRHLREKQLIVCTHSPEIGADYIEWYVELRPKNEA